MIDLIAKLKELPPDAGVIFLEYDWHNDYWKPENCWDEDHHNFREYVAHDIEGVYYNKKKNEVGLGMSDNYDDPPEEKKKPEGKRFVLVEVKDDEDNTDGKRYKCVDKKPFTF